LLHLVPIVVLTLLAVVIAMAVAAIVVRLVVDFRNARVDRACARLRELLHDYLRAAISEDRIVAELAGDRATAREALLRVAGELPAATRDGFDALFRHFGFDVEEQQALADPHWARRLRAATRLGLMGVRAAAPALVGALNDEMLDVRLAAAQSLASLRVPEAIEPLLRALALPGSLPLGLVTERLVPFGPLAVAPLERVLQQRSWLASPAAIAAAAEALGMLQASSAVPALLPLLGDSRAQVRVCAVRALGRIGGDGVAPALRTAVDDGEWQVRNAAVQALGRVRDAEAIPLLQAALGDGAWWVRYNAAQALAALGAAGTAALVGSADGHADRYARDMSRYVLGVALPRELPA
jgi:HEAT repeat protein